MLKKFNQFLINLTITKSNVTIKKDSEIWQSRVKHPLEAGYYIVERGKKLRGGGLLSDSYRHKQRNKILPT